MNYKQSKIGFLIYHCFFFQENGSDIAKVACYYSLSTDGVHTHLMGSPTTDIFNKNFSTVTNKDPADLDIQLAKEVKAK